MIRFPPFPWGRVWYSDCGVIPRNTKYYQRRRNKLWMRANRVAFTARRPAAWPASIRTTVGSKRKRHGRTHDPRSREGLARGEGSLRGGNSARGHHAVQRHPHVYRRVQSLRHLPVRHLAERDFWRCARFSSTMTVPNCRHLGTFFFCRQLRNVPKCRVLRRLACSMRWRGRLPVLALSLPI